jgi:hypothetical protein
MSGQLGRTRQRKPAPASVVRGGASLEACPGLSGDELERRIDDLRNADMLRMSLRSKQLRRKAAEQLADAEAAEAELADMTPIPTVGGPDAA